MTFLTAEVKNWVERWIITVSSLAKLGFPEGALTQVSLCAHTKQANTKKKQLEGIRLLCELA